MLDLILPPLEAGTYVVRRENRPDITCALTVAPQRAFKPERLKGEARLWGLSAQLYGLSRRDDQGIGDFTTLALLAEAAAARGGAVVGINPLHALFPEDRARASPYYPSDRRFLDPLYLDLSAIPFLENHEFADQGPFASSIDYARVWAAKARALEASFARGRGDPGFAAFLAAGGEALRRFALFQAIAETQTGRPWRDWPAGLDDPGSSACRDFAQTHADRLAYHAWLQWLCEGQFAVAARRGEELAVGICRDLAVGAAPDGAETWACANLIARGVSIGAPPDPFGPKGQVWGLPPFDPHRMRAEGLRAHRALYAANMRHAGALRIDHVMGLARQFWVPDGAEGSEGAYVAYPLRDLLAALALESHRARCLVIGEDLGTVPEGLRETLAEAGLLSYRVLPFERDGVTIRPPPVWPRQAWACVATHDLPPLLGWWAGEDIAERERLGLMTSQEADAARAGRLDDKAAVIRALADAGLLEAEISASSDLTPELAAAIHGFIAVSNAVLAVAQVEDLAGTREAVNLPGTDHERPNWRRRIVTPIEDLFNRPLAQGLLTAISASRAPPRPSTDNPLSPPLE
jgi:glycogen operon protein